MAVTALTLQAERWLDQVILFANSPANVLGAALSESFSLPPGLGDVALLNLEIRGHAIDVVSTGVTPVRGVRAFILSGDQAAVVDNVGVTPWILTQDGANALEIGAYLDPDALVLWRQNELLSITSPEMDTDATPTGDFQIFAKCVRVRPIEAPAGQGPLQLVRSL